jgi:hypothetical protein
MTDEETQRELVTPTNQVPLTGPVTCETQGRPRTGAELLDGARDGDGILRINNGTGSDAVVALYDNEAQLVTRMMYVQAGTRTSAYNVPSQIYSIRFAFGRNFISTREGFCSDDSASEFDEAVSFAAPEGKYVVEQITLHPIVNGNARTHKVPPATVFVGSQGR